MHCQPPPMPDVTAAPGLLSASGPPPAATAGWGNDNDDPEHPCPICLVNEDNHGRPVLRVRPDVLRRVQRAREDWPDRSMPNLPRSG